MGKREKICGVEWLSESGFREKRIISQRLEKWEGNKGGKVTAAQGADPGIKAKGIFVISCGCCTEKSRITEKLKD